jgi:hypothetical protein
MDIRADNRRRLVVLLKFVATTEREVSRKRSQPILANIGHFLLPLERIRCSSEYIGKTEFFGSCPPHSATFSAATALIMKDKYSTP